jgi:hypothetical protein
MTASPMSAISPLGSIWLKDQIELERYKTGVILPEDFRRETAANISEKQTFRMGGRRQVAPPAIPLTGTQFPSRVEGRSGSAGAQLQTRIAFEQDF